jgi:tetratricopeptide (TPR) repeat protein
VTAAPRSPKGPSATPRRAESTEFLLQSLRDLEAEREAGDIGTDDYTALRDDYTARAAAALRAEQRGQAPPVAPAPSRSWTQRLLVVAGVIGFALLAGVLVAQASGRREQGEGITGEVVQTPTQAASRCIDLTIRQELVDAVGCYEAVLEDDPDNAVARTYLGWSLYLTANSAAGSLPEDALIEIYTAARAQLDRAVEADPAYADARAFQVVLAVREGRFTEAARQVEAFDDLDAPADMQGLVDRTRPEIAEGLEGSDSGSGAETTVPGAEETDPGSTSTPSPETPTPTPTTDPP